MADDLYSVLGVPRKADQDAIKKAYRKLAVELHPDKNQGKGAEDRFKKVTTAYEVLGDPERRANYDEFGEMSLRSGFDPKQARAAKQWGFGGGRGGVDIGDMFGGGGSGGFGDMLGDLFGRGRGRRGPPRGQRGQDVETTVTIDFVDAIRGTTVRFQSPGSSQIVTVRIPAGAADGSRVRAKGHGTPGFGHGPPGDLLIAVSVRDHPHFRRQGDDLHLDLPITIGEAYEGGQVPVPTPTGEVKLTVPALTQSGQVVRLRGKGVVRKNQAAGDLLVRFLVVYAVEDEPEAAAAVRTLSEHADDPREGITF